MPGYRQHQHLKENRRITTTQQKNQAPSSSTSPYPPKTKRSFSTTDRFCHYSILQYRHASKPTKPRRIPRIKDLVSVGRLQGIYYGMTIGYRCIDLDYDRLVSADPATGRQEPRPYPQIPHYGTCTFCWWGEYNPRYGCSAGPAYNIGRPETWLFRCSRPVLPDHRCKIQDLQGLVSVYKRSYPQQRNLRR